LLTAIPLRQCTRAVYGGAAIAADVIKRLDIAARVAGVEPVIVVDEKGREDILELVVAGNSRQMDDPAFRRELKTWLRFNTRAAAEVRDGLFSGVSGNPSLPSWLGPIIFDLAVTKSSENNKTIEQVRSSPGIIVFVADDNNKAGWVAAGRAYERFALQATAEGVKHAFINQAVEVPDVRQELQALLKLGARRPNLIIRFGNGPVMPRSLRRSVGDVVLRANDRVAG
jgi:hypothetical protein